MCVATVIGLGGAGLAAGRAATLPAEFEKAQRLIKTAPPAATLPLGSGAGAGEDFATAIVVSTLPFDTGGSTCGFNDDYWPACTFLGGAPDVVYALSPAADTCIDVDLCNSEYDVALHVYENSLASPVACNDDHCGSGAEVTGLHLTGGNVYYIVVDGWEMACGPYALSIRECPPACVVPQPPGALSEGEPACHDRTIDLYDSGCNAEPAVFKDLDCSPAGITLCGTYGTYRYEREDQRDTDWYRITIGAAATLEYCVVGEAPTQIAILDGNSDCPDTFLVAGSVLGSACERLCCRASVPAGSYWLFVATRYFTGTPCGAGYVLTLNGMACAPIAVTPGTWSHVKSLYRVSPAHE